MLFGLLRERPLFRIAAKSTIFFKSPVSFRVTVKIRPEIIPWPVYSGAERCASRKHPSVEMLLQSVKVLSFLVLVWISTFDILPLKYHSGGVFTSDVPSVSVCLSVISNPKCNFKFFPLLFREPEIFASRECDLTSNCMLNFLLSQQRLWRCSSFHPSFKHHFSKSLQKYRTAL